MNNDIRNLLISLDANDHNAYITSGLSKVAAHVEGIDWTMEYDGRSVGKMTFTIPSACEPAPKNPYRNYYNRNRNDVDKSKPGWSIKQVIFSDPATIVLWRDGTKTVVKCENEVYDPEKGLAMALAKKMLGNKGNYFDVFHKWLPEGYETPSPKKESRPWKIWYRHYDNGKLIGSGVYIKCYQRKNDATRVANKVYGDESKYEFIVSMANPFKEG